MLGGVQRSALEAMVAREDGRTWMRRQNAAGLVVRGLIRRTGAVGADQTAEYEITAAGRALLQQLGRS